MEVPKTEEVTDVESGTEKQEYDYTKADRFTSEIFKIVVSNLPKHFGYGECKKLLTKKLKLKPHKISVVHHTCRGFITFKSEKDKLEAIDKLNGYVLKGKTLEVKNAPPKADAMSQRRPPSEAPEKKKRKLNDSNLDNKDGLTPEEVMKHNVIPWHKMPYKEQLLNKEQAVRSTLSMIRRQMGSIKNLDLEVFRWIMQWKNTTGLCCPMRPILPSPVEDKYRNKCSFTVGKDAAGNIMTGFRLGKYRDQDCAVGSPVCLRHISDKMKQITASFNEYVLQSKHKVHDLFDHTGYWKQIVVREAVDQSVMVIVRMCQQDLSDEDLKTEQTAIAKHFAASGIDVDTLLFQTIGNHNKGFDADAGPVAIVTGKGVIYEKLFDLKFQISSTAFFQCNTLAAEVLYKSAQDMVLKSIINATEYSEDETDYKETILLDICCGTGTIGLTLARYVKRVIGIEMSDVAVEDAKINAKLNSIDNAEFHCGKAEDILPNIVQPYLKSQTHNIVAVVDPPRCGLHQKVIRTIRQCLSIKKLVFISCSLEQAKNNFLDLCRPQSKRLVGLAFKPLLAQPLDLFPHTKHTEVVVLFERIQPLSKNTLTTANTQPSKAVSEEQLTKPVSPVKKEGTESDLENVYKRSSTEDNTTFSEQKDVEMDTILTEARLNDMPKTEIVPVDANLENEPNTTLCMSTNSVSAVNIQSQKSVQTANAEEPTEEVTTDEMHKQDDLS
uniref:tRNA (uracil(54)-C(5))-methyltransferase n=1 Tax=Phallusia mammillata TaxID=59560 RepID=A0A6F9DVR1_9ASCI|nr:tRNA (uracil-5-)-methyltransferase homolog A [Phallusia mammillata]